MKLESITLQNVKCFKRSCPIPTLSPHNILIGPNGSGKTSFFDILVVTLRHFLVRPFLVNEGNQENYRFETIEQRAAFEPVKNFLDKHNDSPNDDQIITIEVSPTNLDFQNIEIITSRFGEFVEAAKSYRNFQLNSHFNVGNWDATHSQLPRVSPPFKYVIKNWALIGPTPGSPELMFLHYLQNLELFMALSRKMEGVKILPTYLYFPPSRSVAPGSLIATLSSSTANQLYFDYFNSVSKQGSSLLALATDYFASKLRKHGDSFEALRSDQEIKGVSEVLSRLGYSWSLTCLDDRKNIYEVVLTKGGQSLRISQASSGEKQMLNFVLGLYALNISGGLVLIDEPELHLHPKWQRLFWEILKDICSSMNNQLMVSTHSPSFISKKDVRSLIRIAKDGDSSIAHAVDQDKLPNSRALMHLINSHNNERIFFADKVVLVEGPTDRIVFEVLIEHFLKKLDSRLVIEVVEARGKANFSKYASLLSAINVPSYVIADHDYLKEVGKIPDDLLKESDDKLARKVFADKKSRDLKTLIRELGSAIQRADLGILTEVWNYLKHRTRVLRDDLQANERITIRKSIGALRSTGIFVLRNGEIEDYLPEQLRTLDGLITGADDGSLSSYLLEQPMASQARELTRIARLIVM